VRKVSALGWFLFLVSGGIGVFFIRYVGRRKKFKKYWARSP